MATPSRDVRALRRGSRRAVPATLTAGPGGAPGLAQRVLAFEAYIGFQHDWVGLLAGIVVAMRLLGDRLVRGRRG